MELSDIWKITFKKIAQTDVRPRTMPCPTCSTCETCGGLGLVIIDQPKKQENDNATNTSK